MQNRGTMFRHPHKHYKIDETPSIEEKHTMTCVSLSGIPDSHTPLLLSYLTSQGHRIVTWSPHISFLVCSTADSYKVREAERLSIPRVLYTTLPYTVEKPLWVETYKPTRLSEVLGHAEQIKQLTAWLAAFPAVENRIALLTGPPGIGKTTVAHLVAAAAGYGVVERNASDERSGKAVRALLETATQSKYVGSKRVLIMDEVDGSGTGDRGGIAEIARLCKTSTFPILCIANERTIPKLRPLVAVSMDVRFSRPSKITIAKMLKLRCPTKSAVELELLVEQSGNDIRSCINTLQFQGGGGKGSGKDTLLRMDPFSAAGRLFSPHGTLNERSSLVFVDYGIVPLMVSEGYIAAAGKGHTYASDTVKLERCAAAAEWLGFADILDKRIHRTQSWDLMTHAVVATTAAASIVAGPAPFQIWPQWLGKNSKRTKHRKWIRDMEQRSGMSALDTRELLRIRLFRSGRTAVDIVEDLESLRLTRDDMMDTLTDVCFEEDAAQLKTLDTKTKTAITREWNKRSVKKGTEKAQEEDNEEEDIVSDTENQEFIDA